MPPASIQAAAPISKFGCGIQSALATGRLGSGLLFDAIHFVHDQAETVSHVDDCGSNAFTRFAGEYEAGCFTVYTDA